MNISSQPEPLSRRRFLGVTAVIGSAVTARMALDLSPASAAQVPEPTVHGCAEWGARPPHAPIILLDQPSNKLIIHHTTTANSVDHSLAHAFALARITQNYQMGLPGWRDTGHHFLVSRGAHVLEGRHRSIEGLRAGRHVASSHCRGQNNDAVGVENEGEYSASDLRAEHYAALLRLCAHVCAAYRIRAYQIYGHRDFNRTVCPGDRLYADLPRLRADVASLIGGDPTPPAWATARCGDTGERVRSLQYLLRAHGSTVHADATFGPDTESAVRAFQTEKWAIVNGVAGPQTWNQLSRPLASGASGEAVKAVQSQLRARGITDGPVDGTYGPDTAAAVAAFQRASQLPADGVTDPRTLAHLLS
jgi:hypothetical protein